MVGMCPKPGCGFERSLWSRLPVLPGVSSYGAGYAVDGTPLPSDSAAVTGDDRRPRSVTVANGLAAMGESPSSRTHLFPSPSPTPHTTISL